MNIKKFNEFINESLGDICYHMTNFEGLYKIFKTNNFKMSPVTKYRADNVSNKTFYFSTTRSNRVDIGYALNLFDNGGYLVRLKLDGKKLNNNYKSIPYDYWSNDRKTVGHKGTRSSSPTNEMEDRIISDFPYIKDATKYIIGIDIVFDKNIYRYKDGFENYIGSEVYYLVDVYDRIMNQNIPLSIFLNQDHYKIKKNISYSYFYKKFIVPIDNDLEVSDDEENLIEIKKNFLALILILNYGKGGNYILQAFLDNGFSEDFLNDYYDEYYSAISKIIKDGTYYYLDKFVDKALSLDYGIVDKYDLFRKKLFAELKKYGNLDKYLANKFGK